MTKGKPLITLALAAYNESAILEKHIKVLCDYMSSLDEKYDWEIVLINDGSKDNTGAIAELLAKSNPRMYVIHHNTNKGLGRALRTAFAMSKGDYVITLDIDLTSAPEYIEKLLTKIQQSHAKVVIGSPLMKGGEMTAIPWFRRVLSVGANWFLSRFSTQDITCLTNMYRVYDGDFIRSLNLRSEGMEIMPEIIYKTSIMNEKVKEIPIHLNWSNLKHVERRSSMRIFRHTIATLFTGFLLKPFLFFILPGILILLFALYTNTWMFIHFFNELGTLHNNHVTEAFTLAYEKHPHTFLFGLLSLLLSIQLIAFGFQSLQNKHYYEELFDLGTKIYSRKKKD